MTKYFYKNISQFITKIVFLFALIFSTIFIVRADGFSVTLKSEVSKSENNKTVRVRATFSKPVLKFSIADVDIDGGSVESIRKLSTVSYLIFVRPRTDVKELDLQIQADKVQSTEKDFNEYASNNVIVKIVPSKESVDEANKKAAADNEKQISSLLDQVVKSIPVNNSNTTQTSQPVQVQYYNCNGQAIPTTQACNTVQTQPTYNPGFYSGYSPTGYYDVYGNYVPPVNTISPLSPISPVSPIYNPYNTYSPYNNSTYNPYNTYTPYTTYSPGYYDTYYDNSGYGAGAQVSIPLSKSKNSYLDVFFGW